MWVPAKVLDWFQISKTSMDDLRTALAAVTAERDALKTQAISERANADWLRIRVNSLEMENKALMEKAFSIKLPVPEVVRAPNKPIDPQTEASPFEDIGEDLARALGFPTHSKTV
jgi:hypothetical protein